MRTYILVCFLWLLPHLLMSQDNTDRSKFRQLDMELPTPTTYRTASGAPGHAYWQQKADYEIDIVLDDDKQTITGSETITYTNNSPDVLHYLWLQLDQNIRAPNSMRDRIAQFTISPNMNIDDLKKLHSNFNGGFKLVEVKDLTGLDLPYAVVETMMRLDLPKPLKPGMAYSFRIKWWYNINNRMEIGGRSGYEYFATDHNYLYTIAQFFPRMCAYTDNVGWQHKQFLGQGEFTLPFGDYTVRITVPADHVIAATGVLQNAKDILTETQRKRLEQALRSTVPVMIVDPDEALKNESSRAKAQKTWVFAAQNVRDFAFASSRKFIWDAMGTPIGNRTVLSMSFYPREGNPLWAKYSTRVVDHTIKTYSKYTIDYPYPVAISVHAQSIGMEYPMICFNGGRPLADGTYPAGTKHGMISVIIHEVGHNFFPMIINSDERQWTWMDEGLNTFVQYLTEQEWDRNYPSRRGPAAYITDYMAGNKAFVAPIMTNSESVFQLGNNAYGKPATALNILRETVLGREQFDFAFKEYCNRWAFRHPSPADFFRTMEDASGTDLDWFWRGWFYTTDHCNQSLASVTWYRPNTRDPNTEKPLAREGFENREKGISELRNDSLLPVTKVEADSTLRDFYNTHDQYGVYTVDELDYATYRQSMDPQGLELIDNGWNYYEIAIENKGGLVMPVILLMEYADGSQEVVRIPAEIWKMGDTRVTKVFPRKRELVRVVLDPYLEIADTDRSDNYYPPQPSPTRFELYKERRDNSGENPMQRMERNENLKK